VSEEQAEEALESPYDAVTEAEPALDGADPAPDDGMADAPEGDLTQDEVSMGQTPADDAGLDGGPADGPVPEEPSTEGTDEGGSA